MIIETNIGLQYKVPKGPRLNSIREFQLSDGVIVATFDGNLNDLDFMVKYLNQEESKSLRTPTYCMIGVDLLLKAQQNKELTKDFVIEFVQLWDNLTPPSTTEERDLLPIDVDSIINNYSELNFYGELSTEFLSTIIYLYVISEKVKPKVGKFRKLLESIVFYCDDKIDFFTLISKLK